MMPEYKIITGKPTDVQKILNQWRHQYEIVIIEMTSFEREISILLIREEKQNGTFR